MFAYAGDLPQISALDNYAPSTITRVYAADGELDRRVCHAATPVVGYDDIAPQLRQAIIAAEDGGFDRALRAQHLAHIAAVTSRDSRGRQDVGWPAGRFAPGRRQHDHPATGAQRCSRGRGLQHRRRQPRAEDQGSHRRRSRSKSATPSARSSPSTPTTCSSATARTASRRRARMYFGKSAKDLSLEEAALLAGIIQSPGRQSPFVNIGRRHGPPQLRAAADGRRGLHHAGRGRAAKKRPIVVQGPATAGHDRLPRTSSKRSASTSRREYGAKALYEGGLAVTTTLDVTLQDAANRAVDAASAQMDKRRGFRRPRGTSWPRARRSKASRTSDGRGRLPSATSCRPSSRAVEQPRAADGARLRIGRLHRRSRARGLRVDAAAAAARPLQDGDLIEVEIETLDDERHRCGCAGADTDRRRRAHCDREPDRPDQGDGGRVRLQPQQVQSRCPGVPSARVDIQADRVHRRHRSRLHAGLCHRGRAVSSIRLATVSATARRTTITSSKDRSPCGARSNSRATSRRSR